MHRTPITRRRAFGLGATAAAVTALRPSPALALGRSAAFSVDLTGQLADVGRARAAGAWTTLPVTRAPRRFDLIGLDWARGAHVHAQLRARRRGGPWTPWTPLHAAGDHAPDGGRPVTGSEPCWTGSADEFQLRLQGDPQRLRANFVRAQPIAAVARRLARRARAGRPPTAVAAQVPAIIARADWGGDTVPPRTTPAYATVQTGFVHHTVTANEYEPQDSPAIVLGICRYHRDHNGWNDIGYNFLVDKYGQVFEGRAGGIDQAVMGAHAQGYNAISTGVSCLGDYEATSFTTEGTEALARLLAWKLPLHGAPVSGQITVTSTGGSENRYPAGRLVTLERISGHRDGDATACPGAVLYAALPALRERVAVLAATLVPTSALTITAPQTVLKAPAALPLAGALRFGDGASPAARPVELQFQTAAGTEWQIVGTVSTGADGGWAATIPALSSGRVRAVLPDDGVHGALAAAPVRITVTPQITVLVAAPTGRTGRRIKLSGTIGPTWPARVQLTLERHTTRGVVLVQRKRVRVRGGRFTTYVRPTRKGRYRLTLEAAGTTVRRKLRAT